MLIFIDSNIFYNNWLVSNANFKNFFKYLKETHSDLLISVVVCNEVDHF